MKVRGEGLRKPLVAQQKSSCEKMTESLLQGPPGEQIICVTCGFCCDGTLFLHAHLDPDELSKGVLPEWIKEHSISKEGKEYFTLPCNYFLGKCTIYDRKRANVCASFRCQLLKDFAEGKVTLDDAIEVVREAVKMRTELLEQYRKISGKSGDPVFRQLLTELGEIEKSASETVTRSLDYDIFVARCNIFEALLTKHIRSTEDFEKMIMK